MQTRTCPHICYHIHLWLTNFGACLSLYLVHLCWQKEKTGLSTVLAAVSPPEHTQSKLCAVQSSKTRKVTKYIDSNAVLKLYEREESTINVSMYVNVYQKCKSVQYKLIGVYRHSNVLEIYTCESAAWTLVRDDGHCTVFPSALQSAHWTMVTLAGTITQLSHPRSGKHKNGYCNSCISTFLHVVMHACTQKHRHTLLHTFHEDLRGHRTALQARTVSNIRCHRVARGRWNCKDMEKDTFCWVWLGKGH